MQRGKVNTLKNSEDYAKADPIKKVAAKATIAYNSGNTAKINVLPNTLCPCPIAAIPLAQTCP